MLVALANGRQYGNRVLIAPGARLDDGLLEVVIVEPMSMGGIASRCRRSFAARCAGPGDHDEGGALADDVDAAGIFRFTSTASRGWAEELVIQTHPGGSAGASGTASPRGPCVSA